MIELLTPNKLKVSVPENINEDKTPRFTINDEMQEAINYYHNNGYVIFSNCVAKETCDHLRELWEKNIKTFKGKIYRQTTAKAEKNNFNKNNWVMNPVLNLQSLNPNLFGDLRDEVDNKVFSNPSICEALKSILGEKSKIVQSMYFEGNSATWEHQDTYYLDSEKIGMMTAGWLALEEIKADAGRFFICPESHKINLGKHDTSHSIADNHDKYIQQVVSIIKSKNMPIKAPYMDAGDVLFWNSRTIHGSLDSQSADFSRSSITMHAIPQGHKLLQFHSRKIELQTDDLRNSLIHRPKDQSKFKNRLIFFIESNFPSIFYWVKNQAIKLMIRKKKD
jgi:phytanoyl-CoA hydroxylase